MKPGLDVRSQLILKYLLLETFFANLEQYSVESSCSCNTKYWGNWLGNPFQYEIISN